MPRYLRRSLLPMAIAAWVGLGHGRTRTAMPEATWPRLAMPSTTAVLMPFGSDGVARLILQGRCR